MSGEPRGLAEFAGRLGHRILTLAVSGAATVLLLLTWSAGASAATLIVNSTADTAPDTGKACTSAADNCTLREAILKANALPGADVIHVPAGTYSPDDHTAIERGSMWPSSD